jgi:hypothetical protein
MPVLNRFQGDMTLIPALQIYIPEILRFLYGPKPVLTLVSIEFIIQQTATNLVSCYAAAVKWFHNFLKC